MERSWKIAKTHIFKEPSSCRRDNAWMHIKRYLHPSSAQRSSNGCVESEIRVLLYYTCERVCKIQRAPGMNPSHKYLAPYLYKTQYSHTNNSLLIIILIDN
ncbi:hypothetical protein NEAUS06_0570 [Nematocida ausubeli]|nr:hypothetical protein NEAUS06_0570 [Nematocida ausubeli]